MLDQYLALFGEGFSIPEEGLLYAKGIGKLKRFQNHEFLTQEGIETENLYRVMQKRLAHSKSIKKRSVLFFKSKNYEELEKKI